MLRAGGESRRQNDIIGKEVKGEKCNAENKKREQ